MIGAIAGDIIGSPWEYANIRTADFPLFGPRSRYTDDTVLTVATASALLEGSTYASAYERFARAEPHQDYGARFAAQVFGKGKLEPYYSLGNGSAMRVSPVGWWFDDLTTVLDQARLSAVCTHNHPDGIKGAQCTAALVFLARTSRDKRTLLDFVAERFDYEFNDPAAILSAPRGLDETCPGTMPVVLAALSAGWDWESCVRLSVSAGGDSDTIACIVGAIAEPLYGLPDHVADKAMSFLPENLASVVCTFVRKRT